MKKIFIYQANSLQALAISRFIKKYSNYIVIGGVEQPVMFNKKSYDRIIIDKFDNIDKEEYDYLLPMGASSSFDVVNKFQSLRYKNDICFNKENLIVFDKPKMLNIAINLNIPTPKTWYAKENINHFPIFYKEDFENGKGDRGIANNIKEIPENDRLIFQEYINTPSTYGVGFLAKNGEILTFIIHKEIISYPKEGGTAIVVDNFYDKRLLQYTKKLLQQLKYSGWGLAEFKYCNKRDDFVFMEINGKFWASIEFMLINNPSFLYYLLDINYSSKKTNIIYINRLFLYKIIDIIRNLKYVYNRKIIKEYSFTFQILKKIMPEKVIFLLKKALN